MKKIYVSGKITGIESEAEALFEQAEKECIEMGYIPINPMKLNHNHDKSWTAYMREDIVAMMGCESIYMMNNWKESNGAKVERELAIKLEFEILYQFKNLFER